MSLAENFLSTAKQLLLATENLKRLDERVSRLSDDVHGLNHRLIRVEALIEFSKSAAQAAKPPAKRHRLAPPDHHDSD
ncbi:hypothetical protein [Granulicella sibirica]|uniref:Uncharacterized protein n=1 Tax=Granulicella sibirica TaxID=2479048 RepID=A0A4Q0SYY8_9BACT|nr:hypothetical protein [Granulicella sibirica]RXH55642.1 hypothetical protein GRAN_2499 [Granulicella sibirica]